MATNYKNSTETARGKGNYQGMNWITQEKRLAIYLRDGLACSYCGIGVESGATLSLDHIIPHSKGGSNAETNLVTCCTRCNSSRGDRDVEIFIPAVAGYINHGVTSEQITTHITNCTTRDLKSFKVQAKQMIELRGSAAKALANI